jgi:Uma2 family endonuclease
VWFAPLDVVLSNYDVAQPDVLFVSNERSGIITEANVQGAPDLVIEVLSPRTAQYDRGYKRTLYGRFGVREYWLVDPEAEAVEVLTGSDRGLVAHATYRLGDTLASPLLPELDVGIQEIFA